MDPKTGMTFREFVEKAKANGSIIANETYPDPTTVPAEPEPGFVTTDGVLMGNPEEDGGEFGSPLTEGMRPLPEGTDLKLIAAVVDVLNRASCSDFEIAWDDEKEPEHAWSAHCELRGGEDATVRNWPSPEEAAWRLARKVLNGSRCASCGRVMTLARPSVTGPTAVDAKYCIWTRESTQFERGCIDTHTDMQATEEAFAQVAEEH